MNESFFAQNKIFKHIDKIQNWSDRELETLVTAEIDMTNKCNAKCPGCIGGRKNANASISKEESHDIIDQLTEIGLRGLIFTGGGEPLVNKHTPDAIKYAKSKGLDIGIITNGILLNEEIAEIILENCTWCRVSLNAGNEKTYKLIQGLDGNLFNKAVANTQKISQLKKEKNSECTIGIAYLTGKATIEGMENFAKLGKKLDIDYSQFRPFHGDFTEIENELSEIKKKYQTNTHKIVDSTYKYEHFKDENKRPYGKCFGVNFATVIGADLNVYACCHTRGIEKYSLGNLREKSFKNIWKDRFEIPAFQKITNICPLFCRADTFNRILWEIKNPQQHQNFL
ncbi:MAG: radical SAM protein [Nanoarchaeota archaeon]